MPKVSRDRRIRLGGLAGVAAAALLTVTACGGSGSSTTAGQATTPAAGGSSSAAGSSTATGQTSAPAAAGQDASAFTVLSNAENTTVPGELKKLAAGACSTEDAALPLQIQTVPQASLDQKLQLLAGQGALPAMFAAGNAPATTKTLVQAGDIANLQEELTKLGVINDVEPAAVSTIKNLYGGFYVIPDEFNIEGIFYNKKIFSANGVSVPTTWDELTADAAKLQAKGIQPFSASGQQGWPITRLISGYLYRSLGPDALNDIASGKAKLTDPTYVKAAQAVADLGAKGYFGKGVESIDYNTAVNTFLTGKAAMLYMGTWVLANISDKTADTVGAGNIGFMPFPSVAGGAGDTSQYPANVGLPFTFGAKTLGPKTEAWLKCIVQNYGAGVLKDYGTYSGFTLSAPVSGLSALQTDIQQTMASSKQSVLWFEAQFSTQATTVSQQDASPLVNGSMSPSAFMSAVQAAQSS
ncbi:extracellular solute-binding protein [Trebonia kvetii]|uniref:Extracellular solute-binding protein n=1 Tax=Trebonia kvetii TaxID=2480626 RepID=A0A6P2BVS2_9ACTN|nr:extracellular solute-binding protein [Trebonia kvetii]TVZ02336.1 extracellular solute-binding protein [Trebonia kvetii]